MENLDQVLATVQALYALISEFINSLLSSINALISDMKDLKRPIDAAE